MFPPIAGWKGHCTADLQAHDSGSVPVVLLKYPLSSYMVKTTRLR